MSRRGEEPAKEESGSAKTNGGPTVNRGRRLIYIPIIHTAADMGSLGASIRGKKVSTLGRPGLAHQAAVVDKMWEKIESVAASSHWPRERYGFIRTDCRFAGTSGRLSRSWPGQAVATTGCCWRSRRAGLR